VPYLITSDDKSIEGVGCLGLLRLCFAMLGEGKYVATKVLEGSVEVIPIDNASEAVGDLGPATEVIS